MTTYRMPPEPAGPVWRWLNNRWVRYERDERDGLWHNRTFVGVLAKTWGDLLAHGDVVDVEPIKETLDELEQAVVTAAVVWEVAQTPNSDSTLRKAVRRYNRKRHQMTTERNNT